MIDSLSSINALNTNMRKVEGEVKVTLQQARSEPTNVNNQMAFYAALEKRAHMTAAATTVMNYLHNSRRTILNSF